MSDSIKLRRLKEIRRKDLEKNLLDVELKGYDHYIFIIERNKAQVGFKTRRLGYRTYSHGNLKV